MGRKMSKNDEWEMPWDDEPNTSANHNHVTSTATTWDDNEDRCPACNQEIITASGPQHAPILLVGEFPGKEETQQGVVMVGAMGGVLRNEMSFVGLDFKRCRKMNLWQHVPPKTKKPPFVYDADGNIVTCYDIGVQAVIDEAQERKAILLMGSDVVREFVGKSVTEVTGLLVNAPRLPNIPIVACLNPAIVFHGSVGELRFALKNFAKAVEGLHE